MVWDVVGLAQGYIISYVRRWDYVGDGDRSWKLEREWCDGHAIGFTDADAGVDAHGRFGSG